MYWGHGNWKVLRVPCCLLEGSTGQEDEELKWKGGC